MALLYGYGTGSTVESFRYDQVADLLNQIPNNTTNLVKAKDVRDSVFTLWERINELDIIVASASTTPLTFTNPNPTTISVGGISSGTTFPTPQTIQEMFDAILYPYIIPTISLTPNIIKEYGQSLISNLTWSVTKKSNSISSVNIAGINITPLTGNTQTGNVNVGGTYSFPLPTSTTNSFLMQVNDGVNTTSTSSTITWMNKIYWGYIDLSGLVYPNPDLTLNPSYTTLVSGIINSSLILTLNGAGVGIGSELSITKNKTYTGINSNGKYLIFAWPTSVSGSTTPTFTINGLINTSFTRVKTNWAFTNSWNTTTNYEVWVSNTPQNSPLNITIN